MTEHSIFQEGYCCVKPASNSLQEQPPHLPALPVFKSPTLTTRSIPQPYASVTEKVNQNT